MMNKLYELLLHIDSLQALDVDGPILNLMETYGLTLDKLNGHKLCEFFNDERELDRTLEVVRQIDALAAAVEDWKNPMEW